MNMDQIACSNCGYIGKSKRVPKGSMAVEIVLWLCFILPGLIYSVWRMSSYHASCPVCGSQNLVPLNSPNGRKILESQGKTSEEVTKLTEAKPMNPTTKKLLIAAGITFGILVLIGGIFGN